MRWLTRVSTRGRVTIPKENRAELKLEPGDRVAFVRIGDDIYMQPVKDTLLDKMGTIPVSGPQDFEQIREETKKIEGRCNRSLLMILRIGNNFLSIIMPNQIYS